MHYLQAVFIRELISTTMDSDTFQLIQKLCNEFKLSPDIEFTCYEAYMAYFRSYFVDLQRRLQQKTMQLNGNGNANTTINTDIAREVSVFATNEFIDKLLHEVEQTSLLHTLALISICAKYINGFRSAQLFNHFSAYLQLNGTPYSIAEIRHSEYIVFKFVGFNIKPSELYSVAVDLANKISNRNHTLIHFERLHDGCVSLLRLIYLYRKRFDEILHYVEQNTYGFKGNEEFKLAAATVYVSTMINYPQFGCSVLSEIVHHTYLNESFLRKFGQSIQEFYLDHNNFSVISQNV